MHGMPKYSKFRRELLSNKKRIVETSNVLLTDTSSAAVQNTMPEKRRDPGSLTLPCQFGNLIEGQALADSGASINIMPYSFYEKLGLPEPEPVQMVINLANKTTTYPRGIVEDLLVKVDKFIFPTDFVIIDMLEDDEVPIILGRPFLSTARALVDIEEAKLTLRVEDEEVTFGIDHLTRKTRSRGGKHVQVEAVEAYMDWDFLKKRKEMNDKEEMRAIDMKKCENGVCVGQIWKPGSSEDQVFVCKQCEGVKVSPDTKATT